MRVKSIITNLVVHETKGLCRISEPISVGVPLPEGLIKGQILTLYDSVENICLLTQNEVLQKWPDGSAQWVLLDALISIAADSQKELQVVICEKSDHTTNKIDINHHALMLIVDTGRACFHIDKKVFKPFDQVLLSGEQCLVKKGASLTLTTLDLNVIVPLVDKIEVETVGEIRVTVKISGQFALLGQTLATYVARLSFFADQSLCKLEFTITNPNAAIHPGGLWDLGDPGSLLFGDLSLNIEVEDLHDTSFQLKNYYTKDSGEVTEIHIPRTSTPNIRIYQDSSGGTNWNSTNHLNKDGVISTSFRGYQVTDGECILEEGERVSPSVILDNSKKTVSLAIKNFWQNFPKSLGFNNRGLKLGIFPGKESFEFELQAGERKTHEIWFGFSDSINPVDVYAVADSPLIAKASPGWYAETKAISYLFSTETVDSQKAEALVQNVIVGDNSFFKRREVIDEYGWRNFGEIYADHEAVGHTGNEPLISHYNNQYDCIYGALFQYFRTGEPRWFSLADQHCMHVKDIDIYHTKLDRVEYNNGLFWHTDHYIDARTSTHRCYSVLHGNKKNLKYYGGGPALSHVYASGIYYHYLLTGCKDSLECYMMLSEYVVECIKSNDLLCRHFYDTLRGIAKRVKGDTSERDYHLEGPGRASGNALKVMMDAYLNLGEKRYLHMGEKLIRDCVSPDDNIEERNLANIELRWMYVVFLQSLGRYLDIKSKLAQYDKMYFYARTALLHYSNWMVDNEELYLKQAEKLEFPNETWAAQDLRKSEIFAHAANHVTGTLRERFHHKSKYFYSGAINQLLEHDTKTLVRPLVLVMQNYMVYPFYQQYYEEGGGDRGHDERNNSLACEMKVRKLPHLLRLIQDVSFSRELQYVRSRFITKFPRVNDGNSQDVKRRR
jgi:hypothetical protein